MRPLLSFDFKDYEGQENAFTFTNPLEIIIASTIGEVLPSLKKVQDAVNRGYYAAGYLSYEAAPAFDHAFRVNSNQKMPLLWFGIFEQPIKRSLQSTKAFYTSKWQAQTGTNAYNRSIQEVKQHIEQGNTTQVNYTIQMKSQFIGDPIAYYKHLAKAQSADYSAYIDIGEFTIVSASPELFFHLKDRKITTKPMKGTVGRGETDADDKANASWLYHSEKNRAENEMVVNVMRDELGKIATPGTVNVPHMFSIEKYPTVYQMTSTVTAEISPDKSITDIFKALFPCGSITGSPKVNTMEIIKGLEISPREVYCGTIGFITPGQEAIFNVPIRTVMIDNKNGNATYGVGGGITKDSAESEEYEEVLTKAKILDLQDQTFQLLESLGLSSGKYFVLENHLQRLKRSATFFHFDVDLGQIKSKLFAFANDHQKGNWKIRLLVTENGSITLQSNKINPIKDELEAGLACEPIDKRDIFLYHKTTNRIIYDKLLNQSPHVSDVLLWNENREVTEFTIGNIVVKIDGNLYTPPVECGLLAGTYREALIEDGTIDEKKIMLDDIAKCAEIWLINSVRKWVPVHLNIRKLGIHHDFERMP